MSRLVPLVVPLAVLALAACKGDSPITPSDTNAALSPEILTHGAAHDPDQPVFYWLTDQVVAGATSALTRTPNGVTYQLKTRDLEPGHAYTLWIVIFNNPAGCEHGMPGATSCGPMDVVNDAARPDMMYAAGALVGGSGRATFAGRRNVGDPSGSANAPVDLPAYGLEDAYGAEIHLVVHHHGPKLSAFLPGMIQTIDGGCFDAGVPEAGAASPWNDYAGPAGVGAFGRRGPNTCASVQAAAHTP
jgi:hypothetical protein